MHIVYKDTESWINQNPKLKKRFNDLDIFIQKSIRDFSTRMSTQIFNKTNTQIKIEYSSQVLKQSLIDAFDDLTRLKNYHPIDNPNPIKEMSYIMYWFVRRKPIRLVTEDIVNNSNLSNNAKTKLLFINETFATKSLLGSTFDKSRKIGCQFQNIDNIAEDQLLLFEQYLLYYLVYRVSSPKEIEAILLGCTIHPIWNVEPIIWNITNEDINDEF